MHKFYLYKWTPILPVNKKKTEKKFVYIYFSLFLTLRLFWNIYFGSLWFYPSSLLAFWFDSIDFCSLSLSLTHSLCLNNFDNQKKDNFKLLDHIHTLSHSVNINKVITCFAFVFVVQWILVSLSRPCDNKTRNWICIHHGIMKRWLSDWICSILRENLWLLHFGFINLQIFMLLSIKFIDISCFISDIFPLINIPKRFFL